jgi:hypothetical protein
VIRRENREEIVDSGGGLGGFRSTKRIISTFRAERKDDLTLLFRQKNVPLVWPTRWFALEGLGGHGGKEEDKENRKDALLPKEKRN